MSSSKGPKQGKGELWPPWKLPAECDPHFKDPRLLLHSKYAHGLIFNLLHKAVHGDGVSERTVSLSVFLLQLALSLRQTQDSVQNQESESWHTKPVDLLYSTWYPTDCLFSNLSHTVTELLSSQPPASGDHTSMEVDQVQDSPLDLSMPGHSELVKQATITTPSSVTVNESILSLLLKLHSRLSGRPDSYLPSNERRADPTLMRSRIGDGCFFIEKVLDTICNLDGTYLQLIQDTRTQLWPTEVAVETERVMSIKREEAEDRRQKAHERRQKILGKMAARQRVFRENTMEVEGEEEEMEADRDNLGQSEEYVCVLCHQSQASSEDRPMGLVVVLQTTSVLGHKKRQDSAGLVLPTSEEEETSAPYVEESLASEYRGRLEELVRQFDSPSHLMSVNIGWQGGVHVQSCGHHIHLACHDHYMTTLKFKPGADIEFPCPMCRRLANTVLPILPDMKVVRPMSQSPVDLGLEVADLLRDPHFPEVSPESALMQAKTKFIEKLSNTTPHLQHKIASDSPNHANTDMLLFLCSVARTNLELDLVTRCGAETSQPPRSFLPLLRLLGLHTKASSPRPPASVCDWSQVGGTLNFSTIHTLVKLISGVWSVAG